MAVKTDIPVLVIGAGSTGFQQNNDCVTATLKHGDGREEVVTAQYIIGCDGAHSTVRHTLDFDFKGAPYPQTFALADVVVQWDHHYDEVVTFMDEACTLA